MSEWVGERKANDADGHCSFLILYFPFYRFAGVYCVSLPILYQPREYLAAQSASEEDGQHASIFFKVIVLIDCRTPARIHTPRGSNTT